MPTVIQSRIAFGALLHSLRIDRGFTLRRLQEVTGVTYSMISCIEHGDRAIGADVAERIATAFQLEGIEREQFLFAAAATRRKDRLVAAARTLAPELVNFVPTALARFGVDLAAVDRCEVRHPRGIERAQLLENMRSAISVGCEEIDRSQLLFFNSGGQRLACALVVAPVS